MTVQENKRCKSDGSLQVVITKNHFMEEVTSQWALRN